MISLRSEPFEAIAERLLLSRWKVDWQVSNETVGRVKTTFANAKSDGELKIEVVRGRDYKRHYPQQISIWVTQDPSGQKAFQFILQSMDARELTHVLQVQNDIPIGLLEKNMKLEVEEQASFVLSQVQTEALLAEIEGALKLDPIPPRAS